MATIANQGIKLIVRLYVTACLYENSSASLIGTTLWHYLGTKHLDFRHENNSALGVLIEETQYMHI